MSGNFVGVTFAKQKVTPPDDAVVRRALLNDGALAGCQMSYSGSTLTMASGTLLVCGRQIRHPASQNWAVVDASSGYARLVLTIDLTLAATKETFEQVVDSIEYASSVDGFPELEQTDINESGSRYQFVACVVSLGPGGITGIVSPMPKSKGGNGLDEPIFLKKNIHYGSEWPVEGLADGRLFYIDAESAAAAELGV